MKALIPISTDSRIFTSDGFERALLALPPEVTSWKFLIADKLQAYNRADNETREFELKSVFSWASRESNDLTSRRNWLRKILRKIGKNVDDPSVEILGIDDICDALLHTIYRNVLLLFLEGSKFAHDIQKASSEFCSRRGLAHDDRRIRLSMAYILEEISINIRIRVPERIYCEFYIGTYPDPLIRLYSGHYGVTPYDIVGDDFANGSDFEFFSFNDSHQWRKLSMR